MKPILMFVLVAGALHVAVLFSFRGPFSVVPILRYRPGF